jgi:hypothetical protein
MSHPTHVSKACTGKKGGGI